MLLSFNIFWVIFVALLNTRGVYSNVELNSGFIPSGVFEIFREKNVPSGKFLKSYYEDASRNEKYSKRNFQSSKANMTSSGSTAIVEDKVMPSQKSKLDVTENFTSTACDPTGRYCWNTRSTTEENIKALNDKVKKRNPGETEFLQAFSEVSESLKPVFDANPKYLSLLEVISEPEKVVHFRVPWIDDAGKIQVNRGFRVQFNSALGPYKGGLRFHPSVTMSVIKFLGFEQIFKNSLTGLSMGGGKGGSDFDPKGKSDSEVLRFCQSFMTNLARYIGANEDVPAGDIGVGGREIGYLFGQYKRLKSQFEGVLTGKDVKWGGSFARPEATGYGVVYFAKEVLNELGTNFQGQPCVVSGSGNVALHCADKLIDFGASVRTLSDSTGYIHEENGFTKDQIKSIRHIKEVERRSIADYLEKSSSAKYYPKQTPWNVPCVYSFPCATQNEINLSAAADLVKNGCKIVVEGANMPCDNEAIKFLKENNVILCPAKAANAGGVSVSGLEMSQNSMRIQLPFEEVDSKLQKIMSGIFRDCKNAALKYGKPLDLQMGANIAGFLKVADSVHEQGCV